MAQERHGLTPITADPRDFPRQIAAGSHEPAQRRGALDQGRAIALDRRRTKFGLLEG